MRMVIALGCSLIFTFTYATLAAKSRRAEAVLVPLLDILQSVPILSFSILIVFFLSLTPGRVAGAEMASVFLIFTSQAWNMAFSFYQSLRSIPDDLQEVSRSFHLVPVDAVLAHWKCPSPCQPLIWNMMMSMSGGCSSSWSQPKPSRSATPRSRSRVSARTSPWPSSSAMWARSAMRSRRCLSSFSSMTSCCSVP